MILTEFVDIKIAPKNYTYWKSKGYDVKPTGGKGGKNTGQKIRVKVSDLQPKSNVDVECRCDTCGNEYMQRFSRNKDICNDCRRRDYMTGNDLGKAHKGRTHPSMMGALHPRWNANKNLFRRYSYRVRRLSEANYALHKDTINPQDHPRTLCGVEGGYQLDHKISIKEGFKKGLSPEELAHPDNLQMLPWSENREKW